MSFKPICSRDKVSKTFMILRIIKFNLDKKKEIHTQKDSGTCRVKRLNSNEKNRRKSLSKTQFLTQVN